VRIYDERGELVQTLCGLLPAMGPQVPRLTLSDFTPAPSGNGGTLTLYLNGQVLAVWDATDKNGKLVSNGFYFLVVDQPLANGTQVELQRTVFVAPEGRTAPAQLTAWPNVVHGGGEVRLTAIIGTSPADGSDPIRIYSIGGELVRSLTPSNGQAVWDLTNGQGRSVASGLYLLVLDGTDASGDPVRQTIKVAILR